MRSRGGRRKGGRRRRGGNECLLMGCLLFGIDRMDGRLESRFIFVLGKADEIPLRVIELK
jgi:hypothetical protein